MIGDRQEETVPLLYYIQNSIVSIILLGIVLWYVLGKGGKRQAQDSIFVALLFCALSIVVFEFLVDLLTGKAFFGSRMLLNVSAFGLYMGNPLLGALYLLYLDQLRRKWVRIPFRIGFLTFVPPCFACILCFLSMFNGMIFSVDADNLYHRGASFYLITLIAYGYFIIGVAYLLYFRNSFRHKAISLLLFFPFPILIGSLLQIMFFGIEVAGISMVLTLLIIFLHMQNSQANKDHLTSLYNRSLSEQYLSHLISHQKKAKPIGGILMDINDFKRINDAYGHDLGDTSLRFFSRLLSDSFRSGWLIARYGGDEFILLREGSSQQELAEELAHFYDQFSLFNAKKILPFPLSVSVGSALYEAIGSMDGPSFIKVLDVQMYEHKRIYHAQQNGDGTTDESLQGSPCLKA